MGRLEQTTERYLRSPALSLGPGGATLHLIAWEADGERVLSFPVDLDGEPGDPTSGAPREAIPALDPDDPRRGTDRPVEDRAVAGAWRVEVRRDGYRSTVVALPPEGGEVVVWEADATAAAPAVVAAGDGAWIAFHHNLREDRGTPDLAKWIALRYVDASRAVKGPRAAMTDRDRDREGEEQSFEYPSLVVGEDGAVALFGRGSHRFWRQDLGAGGFSPRVPLGDGTWGCRGRRVAAVGLAGGRILTARRERRAIELDILEGPTGGAPALGPAQVRPPSARITTAGAGAGRTDPAVRWGRRTLFGDIHQHSAHSDGIGTADEPYLRARHLYGDDFCALTDHESFLGKRIGPGEWRALEAAAERHDDPDRFATLIAYEWTARMHPGPGHKVVYLPGPGRSIVSRDDVPEGLDLVRAVRELGGFAVPHHVGWTGADEGGHDPIGQPVWEICSCHGCYESFAHALGQRGDLRDQMVDAVMRRGHRFGFIACSDGHGLLWHHGVARKRDPFRTGLTAVQAEGCTREAILAAIRDRRCYATSGTRILLDLRAGDQPMGSELAVTGPVEVEAEAEGTAPVARLDLVGSEGVLASVEPGEGETRASLGARVRDRWVYARVVQVDGEMAWSSPLFFDPS